MMRVFQSKSTLGWSTRVTSMQVSLPMPAMTQVPTQAWMQGLKMRAR